MSDEREEGVAPAWHTVALVAIGFALSALGTPIARASGAHGHLAAYAAWLGIELGILAFVWMGLRLRGHGLRMLLGASPWNVRAVLRHVGTAMEIVFLTVTAVVLVAVVTHTPPPKLMYELQPRTWLELVVYETVAIVAAIAEELAFRGYLLRQFATMTTTTTGVLAQAFVFGASHGYEGPKMMIAIGLSGIALGLCVVRFQSVRPCIIARILLDLTFGCIYFAQHH